MKFSNTVGRTFTIRALLLLVLLCAVGLAVLVVPRMRRNRLSQRLEAHSEIVGWVQYADETFFDRMLGTVGRVESIAFIGTEQRPRLSQEVFDVASELSPLVQLELENVEVESASRFPLVLERISVRVVRGKQCSRWLQGLLESQECIQQIEVMDTPAFSDEHVAQLLRIPSLTRVTLDRVSVVGTGFRSLSIGAQKLDVTVANCPVSDEGLHTIAENQSIESLSLSFSADCELLPDLSVLLNAAPTLNVYIELGSDCYNAALESSTKKLELHFTDFSLLVL